MLGGDFNARPTSVAWRDKYVAGASTRFSDFLERNSLVSQLRLEKPLTSMHTHGSSVLDYFLVRKRFASALQDAQTFSPPLYSDHRLLAIRFKIKWARAKNVKNSQSSDLGTLNDSETRTRFLQSANFPNVTIQSLSDAVRSLPPRTKPVSMRPTWYTDYVSDLLRFQVRVRCDEDALLQALDASRVEALNAHVSEYAKMLTSNPRKAWEHLRAPVSVRMRTKFPAQSEVQRLSTLRDHFSKLLSDPGLVEPASEIVAHVFPLRSVTPVFKEGPFSPQELNEAVATLPRNKSCGPDGVPNEVLSLPELRGQVLSMLNQMLISVMPASKLSFFVPLPKNFIFIYFINSKYREHSRTDSICEWPTGEENLEFSNSTYCQWDFRWPPQWLSMSRTICVK